MALCKIRLVLASASPRRKELLERFGLDFEIVPACAGEEAPNGRSPDEYVEALSRAKAAEVAERLNDKAAVIVAADTVVETEGVILGKPRDAEDAAAMLRRLSGQTHRVWSGLCVRRDDTVCTAHECTEVHFRPLTDSEIAAYIRTGEPLDKAGAYGYQGLASLFVEKIDGDYFNVVGLPLCRLGQMLRAFDISLLDR